MRACRYLFAVGLLLASLPAAAQAPTTNVRPGDSVTTSVVRSVPDAVSGILTPIGPGLGASTGTTASVLSNAAPAFAISTRDGWANHKKPCGRDDDDDDDDDDGDHRRRRDKDKKKCPPKSPKH